MHTGLKIAGMTLASLAVVANTAMAAGTGSFDKGINDWGRPDQFKNASTVQYDIDGRTGLCFSFYTSQIIAGVVGYGTSHSLVPCTPAVLAQINQGKILEMKKQGIEPVMFYIGAPVAGTPALDPAVR